jgi:hypothetical protein
VNPIVKTATALALPAVLVAAVFAFSGNTEPGCEPAEPEEPVCYAPEDCEGLPHIMCVGEWQCVSGQCVWDCSNPEPDPEPIGCYGDTDCPDGHHCNAAEVCLPPPGCEDGDICPTVCYGEFCADEPMYSTCVYQEWYTCLQYTQCGHYGPDGACAWEPNDQYLDCLAQYGVSN